MKISEEKFKYIISALVTAITVLGASALGVAILLSELLYPEIEEFYDCPDWYKTFLLTSLVVSAYGVICSMIFTKNSPKRLIYAYIVETKVFIGLMVVGFILMLTVFIDDENYVIDVILCVGGALCSVGLFGMLSSFFSLFSNRYGRPYVGMLARLNRLDHIIKLTRPASKKSIAALEEYIGAKIPEELKNFYDETDGDGWLIFSAKAALNKNKELREKHSSTCPDINELLIIGTDREKLYVCYRIINGQCVEGALMLFDPRLERFWSVTHELREVLFKYYFYRNEVTDYEVMTVKEAAQLLWEKKLKEQAEKEQSETSEGSEVKSKEAEVVDGELEKSDEEPKVKPEEQTEPKDDGDNNGK